MHCSEKTAKHMHQLFRDSVMLAAHNNRNKCVHCIFRNEPSDNITTVAANLVKDFSFITMIFLQAWLSINLMTKD